MAVDMALEEMMGKLGQFGRYQGFQFFLHILAALTAGMHMLSLVTVASVPDHRCLIPEIDNNATSPELLWNSTLLSKYVPLKDDGAINSCQMYANETAVTCSEYVYDNTYYKSSRTMEWNLVCDRRWMGAIAQTVYMFGVFTGAVVLGGMADKKGRKTIFCWSALLQLILGVAVAFTPNFLSFLVLRYLYGIFGSAGSYITGFVLTMELVGSNFRTICGITFQAIFACGIMLVAGWGAIIEDRMMLQVVYGLHGLLLVAHWWIMDESPRWLWNQGRFKESIDIVAKALKMNGQPALDKTYYQSKSKSSTVSSTEQPRAALWDLFKTPNLRKKTLNVCLNWFANSLVYYGLSLGVGSLPGNPFMILFINAVVEIPSYITVVILLDKLGRRSITSFLMLLGGICCIVAVHMVKGETLTTTVVMMGKLFIAGSFAVIYNYSAELFPTVVRNSAMGLGSMCARLSGALTPLIALLDSFDPRVPAIIFGVVSIVSGVWTLFLPETMNQPMPESLEDGEQFGKGDTFFTTGLGRKAPAPVDDREIGMEEMPLRGDA